MSLTDGNYLWPVDSQKILLAVRANLLEAIAYYVTYFSLEMVETNFFNENLYL